MFAYCGNNPVSGYDPSGCRPIWERNYGNGLVEYADTSTGIPDYINYDVPLYYQGSTRICWAYCQIMIEDYFEGISRTRADASARAASLAEEVNGSDWNHGNWPTNSMLNSDGTRENYYIESVEDLFDLLYNFGPVYAFYQSDHGAHLVVVTGVDKRQGLVYTNNPWGISGVQAFDQFLISFTGRTSTEPYPFMYCLIPVK